MFKKAKYVYTIYKEGSFTRAAEALFISQPCLSAYIKQLEKRLGAPLFERTTASVIPTQIGLEYIKTAEKILNLEQEFSDKISALTSLSSGKIRIGSSNYGSTYIFPRLVNEFSKQYPGISITLTEANSVDLIHLLNDNEIDLIIDSFDLPPESVNYHPLITEKILLAVPNNFTSNKGLEKFAQRPENIFDSNGNAQAESVSIANFKNEKFILLKNGNSMYEHAMTIFSTEGIVPDVSLFLDQLSTSYALASQGNGACFVTDTVFKFYRFNDAILLYNLKNSKTRTLGIAQKKGKYSMPAIDKFIKLSLQVLKNKE